MTDAVRAYTQGSAFAAFSDDKVGTLEAGKLADLAVLSQDIFAVPAETIGKTRVLTTMVGGKIVYTAAAGNGRLSAGPLASQPRIQPWKHPARVAFEDLAAVGIAQAQPIEVALGVVEVLSRLRIDAAHGAHHL